MIYISSDEKRQRVISNAVYRTTLQDPHWFAEIKVYIEKGMKRNESKANRVVQKWVQSAEKVPAPLVKEEILKHWPL